MRQLNKIGLLCTAALLVCAMFISSCGKEKFAINTNPNDVTASTVDYKAVFPAALASSATNQATSWNVLNKWLGYWARSGSFQSIDDEETYTFTNDFAVGVWNNFYYNATNYDFVATKAKAAGAGFYEGAAKIMKVWNMQTLVDLYGNIPYSEAFQNGTIKSPKYDDDEAIYKSLLRELDAAIALINGPSGSNLVNPAIATNDIMFGGNALNWKKLANTIKLRMLIHTGNTSFAGATETNTWVSSINQAAEMAIITAEGSGFLIAGTDASVQPGYDATKPNPFYRAYVKTETGVAAGQSFKANAYATGPNFGAITSGYYAWNGDPRIDRFYVLPTTAGVTVHKGIQFGQAAGLLPGYEGANLSSPGGIGLLPNGASTKMWIVTATESLFLQAEAARRGLITGSAQALLKDAITESFMFLGLTAAQANTYITGNATYADVDITATPSAATNGIAGGLYTILSQKWFALNSICPLEVFTDYRRTEIVYGRGGGFLNGPAISVNPSNTKTKIPIRYYYPQNEYSFNTAAVLSEGTVDVYGSAGTVSRSRIFWDRN
jgi:hypothetical protein